MHSGLIRRTDPRRIRRECRVRGKRHCARPANDIAPSAEPHFGRERTADERLRASGLVVLELPDVAIVTRFALAAGTNADPAPPPVASAG